MFKDVVSLANAAARAGISEQAMRMRYRRSRDTANPIGYEQNGQIYIRLVDGEVPEPRTRGGGPNLRVIKNDNALPDNVMPPVPNQYGRSAESVPDRDEMYELRAKYEVAQNEMDIHQREVDRLKSELAEAKSQIANERERYDQLMTDWRVDRESRDHERSREQVMRQQLQELISRFDHINALPAPASDPRIDQLERDNRELRIGVMSLVEYISKKRGQ